MRASRRGSGRTSLKADDAPEITAEAIASGRWYRGSERIAAQEGLEEFSRWLAKRPVNILLDVDVVEFFKRKAGGRGYQTLINQALRESMARETLEATLRRVLREERSARPKRLRTERAP